MKTLVKFVLLVLIGLFCWGWISNVALGKMSTGQYLWKLRMELRQFSIEFKDKITADSKKTVKTKERIVSDLGKWGGTVVV